MMSKCEFVQNLAIASAECRHVFFHSYKPHTGQCKRTGGCYNELVVAFFSTGGGVKGKKNLYLLTLLFIYKLAFILFVMTPSAQTTGNIAVYGSAKQLVI